MTPCNAYANSFNSLCKCWACREAQRCSVFWTLHGVTFVRHHFAVPAKENGHLTSPDHLKRKKYKETLPGTKPSKSVEQLTRTSDRQKLHDKMQ